MLIIAASATDASDLADWLSQAGVNSTPVVGERAMGASETISVAAGALAAVSAALAVVREWIKAHRKVITLELDGRGRIHVEGTDDIDRLLESLESNTAAGASDDD